LWHETKGYFEAIFSISRAWAMGTVPSLGECNDGVVEFGVPAVARGERDEVQGRERFFIIAHGPFQLPLRAAGPVDRPKVVRRERADAGALPQGVFKQKSS